MSPTKTRARKATSNQAVPYIAPPPIQQWLCQDTISELRGTPPRVIPLRDRPEAAAGIAPSGWDLSWIDGLAGGGGSSQGIHRVTGNGVRMAVNHWPLAVETHNYNMPWVEHDVANVARVDPRRYPTTDCAWFSPECTTWSIARGEKCDYDKDWEQLTIAGLEEEDDETPADKEAKWRSRMLMTDVVRFARHHRYKAIIVENVPDILKWAAFGRWLAEMEVEGYRHKVITLNSAFAQGWGQPAPQLRDRVYVVFWLKRYRTPNWNKWLRPKGWCPNCQEVVDSIYTPKPGPRRPMRFGAQYFYRCSKTRCQPGEVLPYARPALSVIDLTRPTQRIGDRKTPLAPKTRQRVADGLRHIAATRRGGSGPLPPMLVPTGGTRRRDAAAADRPMATRTTTENDAVVSPPPFLTVLRSDRSRTIELKHPLATVVADGSNHALVVPLEGRDGQRARGADEPLRAQTTRHQDALVVPLRNNGVARPASGSPLVTVAAGGEHQAVVGHHALYQYDSGDLRPLGEPMPTQTTVEGDAVVGTAADVDDCTLRMLAVQEIKEGMDFHAGYVLLGKAKRNHVRMLGNAVTGCAAADLVACVTEAVTGVDLPRYEFTFAA